jgi:chromosome segregation ATPase
MERDCLIASGLRQRHSPGRACLSPKKSCALPTEHHEGELNEIVHEQSSAERLRLQREKIEVLKLEFERKEEELQSHKVELERMRREQEALLRVKAEKDAQEESIDRLKYELERVLAENHELVAEIQGYGREETEGELARLREENLRLKGEFDRAGVTIIKLERTVATLRLQVSDLEESHRYQDQQNKIKVDGLGEELHRLRKENKELRQRQELLDSGADESNREKEDLELAVARLKQRVEDIGEELACKEGLLSQLKEQSTAQEVTFHRELMEVTSECERRTHELHKREALLNELRLRLSERESALKLCEGSLESASEENERLRKEAKKHQVELDHFRSSKQSGNSVISQLKREIQTRDKKLACLYEKELHERQVRTDLGTLRL